MKTCNTRDEKASCSHNLVSSIKLGWMLNQFRSLSRRGSDKQIAIVTVTVDWRLCPSTAPCRGMKEWRKGISAFGLSITNNSVTTCLHLQTLKPLIRVPVIRCAAITFTRYSTETVVTTATWTWRHSQSIPNFLLFLSCVTMVTGVASHSTLYRYHGQVCRNHSNPGVKSLVTMETGIHGNWHVTQVTHKNYAGMAINVGLYTYMYTHIHRYPWQLACDSGHSLTAATLAVLECLASVIFVVLWAV